MCERAESERDKSVYHFRKIDNKIQYSRNRVIWHFVFYVNDFVHIVDDSKVCNDDGFFLPILVAAVTFSFTLFRLFLSCWRKFMEIFACNLSGKCHPLDGIAQGKCHRKCHFKVFFMSLFYVSQ